MLHIQNQFPDQLAHELLDYARDIGKAPTPEIILNTLHDITARLLHINVWVAMKFPTKTTDWAALKLNQTVFLHASISVRWWDRWIAGVRQNQPLYYTLSRMSIGSFTATEALKILDPIGIDRWSAELSGQFGIRDAFFCPVAGRWVVAFWSPKVLSSDWFTSEMRTLLLMAANFAALRLDNLVTTNLSSEEETITPRELAVLRLFSMGLSSKEVAEHLGIGEETVKTHVQKAQARLGTKNRTHSICEAMRRRLIP